MSRELRRAAMDAKELLGKLGRASTPPVRDRGIALRTHFTEEAASAIYPAVFIGDSAYFRTQGVNCVETHPNSIDSIVARPEEHQALVVNCQGLNGPWNGAGAGWADWKADIIFESCHAFRLAGVPVYVIRPQKPGSNFQRWASVADAIFPGFVNTAEETHNPHTALWYALNQMDNNK